MSDFYEVIPDPPVFDDVNMVVVVPDHEGVEYAVVGEPADGVEVTVTATAADGWVFFGDYPTEWSHTFTEPAPEDEGPETPIPDPNEEFDGSWFPGHGEYMSRNAGRRESLLEAAREIVNSRELADAVDPVANEVHNLGTVVADYGDQLENKVEPWAVPTIAPLSQTINRRADATVQLSDFMLPGGWTGTADGHRHPLGTAGGSDLALAEGWDEGNRTFFAFLTPAINRAYERLHFMVGEVSGTPATMDVAIFVVDADAPGNVLHRQVGNIRISDSIGPGRQLVTVDFDRFVATQGSYIAIAFRQFASGNQRPLLGLNEAERPVGNIVFPRRIGARSTFTSSIPATVTGETQLDFESNWFVPYAELSEAIGIDYRVFTEGWGHSSRAPRPWVALTSTGIWSRSDGSASANSNGVKVSMYDTPLSTDFVRVRTSITRFWPPLTTSPNAPYAIKSATIVIRGTNDLRSGLGLRIHNRDGYSLISWTDTSPGTSWNDRPTIASFPLAPATGQQIEIDYLDGDVVVRIDGVVRLEVTVSDPLGASGRFLGLQFDRDTRGLFGENVYRSSWLGPWSARDLPQSNGDDEEEDGDGEGGGEGEG